ncbi:MAG: hypothetical protein ISR25_05255 [Candidatus Poseidoniaceae archaeon]|nr:hypothetical protein [Candidatus Poseidoniaceae archaeon]
MVGLFVDGWFPSEERPVMIIPLFTMAWSLFTLVCPILLIISGKYTEVVPWFILASILLLGFALFSTMSQRRVLILHRGVHASGLLMSAALILAFIESVSAWVPLGIGWIQFGLTYRIANRTSAGFGVQFRHQWNPKTLLELSANHKNQWHLLNTRPSNGLMAILRKNGVIGAMYCTFEENDCWLHLDVFSNEFFDLNGILIEEE